jgi:hypothetical protein
MSIGSIVLNRNIFKFLIAMAIPAAIGYVFWYSQEQANREVEAYKKEQKARGPIKEEVTINNYAMKEIDDANRVRWQLVASTGKLKENGRDVEMTDVKVEYFDPVTKDLKMRLVAPYGTGDQQTKYVKLMSKDGQKVVAEGQGGKTKFTSTTVELIKKDQFLATGGVNIDWPGVAKVSGDSATGATNLSGGPKNFKVMGNTHAEIVTH